MTGAGQGREGKNKRGTFSPETRGESREEEGGSRSLDHIAGFWGSRRLFVDEEVAGKKRSVPFL
jgi:hypothetical protein